MGVNLLSALSASAWYKSGAVAGSIVYQNDNSCTFTGSTDDDYLVFVNTNGAFNGMDLALGFTAFSCSDNLAMVIISVYDTNGIAKTESFLPAAGLSKFTFRVPSDTTELRIYFRHQWNSSGYTSQTLTLANVYLEETTEHVVTAFPALSSWTKSGNAVSTINYPNQNSAVWTASGETDFIYLDTTNNVYNGKTYRFVYDAFTAGDGLSWFNIKITRADSSFVEYQTRKTSLQKDIRITIPADCARIQIYLRHDYDVDGFTATSMTVDNFRAEELIGFSNIVKLHAKGTMGYGTATASASVPAGYAQGDLLVLLMTGINSAPATPSGWTDINGTNNGTNVFFKVCYKTATASESAVTIGNSNGYVTALILLFKGASSAGPINGSAVGTSSGRTFSTPNLSATVNGAFIVYAIGFTENYSATDIKNIENPYNPALINFAKHHDELYASTTSQNGGLCVIAGSLETAGAAGAVTADADTSSLDAAIVVFAIAPQLTISPCVISVTPDKEKINGSGFVTVNVETDILAMAFEARASLVGASSGRGIGINVIGDDLSVDAAGVHTFPAPTSNWSFYIAYSEINTDGIYRISVYAQNTNGVWSV